MKKLKITVGVLDDDGVIEHAYGTTCDVHRMRDAFNHLVNAVLQHYDTYASELIELDMNEKGE